MMQTNYIFRVAVIVLFTQFGMAAESKTHGNTTTELLSDSYSNSQPEHAIKTTAPAQSPIVSTRQPANQANLQEIDAAVRKHGKTRAIIQVRASDELKRLAGDSDLPPTEIVEAFLNSAEVLYQVDSSGMSVSRRYDFIPFFTAEIDANGLQMLAMHPDVVSIEPDRASRMFLSDSVPKVIGQSNPWTIKYDGNKSWVAVLDSAIDISHPMFAGKQILEACYTTDASCPNGQNYQIGPGAVKPSPLNINRINGTHGTHVAGIAVGNYIPGEGMGGVAHNANLIAIRVFDNDHDAYRSSVLAALNYVYELAETLRVAAANLSFGEGRRAEEYHENYCDKSSQAITAAMRSLRQRHVASVVAAQGAISVADAEGATQGTLWVPGQGEGAEHIPVMSFPACISHAVSVTLADKTYNLISGGAHTYFVSMIAPGERIRSAVPGGGYAVMSGASMAAPHISGLFAILRDHRPNATVAAIQSALDNSGRNIRTDPFTVMWPIAAKALDNIGGHPGRVIVGFNVPEALKRMQDYGTRNCKYTCPWKINTGSFYGGYGVAYNAGSSNSWEDIFGYGNPISLMLPPTHFNGSIAAKIRRVGGAGEGANCLDVRNTKVRQFANPGQDRGYHLCYKNSGSAFVRFQGNGPYPYPRLVCPEQAFTAVRPNDWNTLLTTTGGKYVKFYINGSLLCQHENKTIIYGRPGISFYNVFEKSQYLVDWFYTKVTDTNDQHHEL